MPLLYLAKIRMRIITIGNTTCQPTQVTHLLLSMFQLSMLGKTAGIMVPMCSHLLRTKLWVIPSNTDSVLGDVSRFGQSGSRKHYTSWVLLALWGLFLAALGSLQPSCEKARASLLDDDSPLCHETPVTWPPKQGYHRQASPADLPLTTDARASPAEISLA